jgi:ankyrin repeat protein
MPMSRSAEVFTAIRNGDGSGLQVLLAAAPTLAQSTDPSGVSALMTAVYYGHADMVASLIEHGAELDLFSAAATGNTASLEELLSSQPTAVSRHSPDGWTALALAAHFNQVDAARLLLKHGADLGVRSRNSNGNTPLHAALAGRGLETARLLLGAGADVNAADAAGWTPLHLAADSGDAELVLLVLNEGPFVDPENKDGLTPLALALKGGHVVVAALLRPHSATSLE